MNRPAMSFKRWSNIMKAMELYQELGYNYVDVPWIVDRHISVQTCPDRGRIMGVPAHGDLVGSAEQGFMQVAGGLKPGRFMSLSPCFRDEGGPERLISTHRTVFVKLELYSNLDTDSDALADMIDDARSVMSHLTELTVTQVQTEEGFDLNINSLEVGSYGVRTFRGRSHLYGTGLAEPRFSIAQIYTPK